MQTEIYAVLACAHDNQMNARPEKYVSSCCDSQAALKALQAAKTTSPSVQQCQQALNYISTRHSVGLFWVPEHSGVQFEEMKCRKARKRGYSSPVCWTGTGFGGLWAEYKRRDNMRDGHQHVAMWCGLISTQRQAPKLISGPNPNGKDQTTVM